MELFGLAIAFWVGLYIWGKIKEAIKRYKFEQENEELDLFSINATKSLDFDLEKKILLKHVDIGKNYIQSVEVISYIEQVKKYIYEIRNHIDNLSPPKIDVNMNNEEFVGLEDIKCINQNISGMYIRCTKCRRGVLLLKYGVFGPYRRCNRHPECTEWKVLEDVSF